MLKFNLKSCFFNPRKFNFLLLLKKSSRGKVIFQGEIQPRIVWMLFQASFGNVYSAAIPKGKLPLAKQENQAGNVIQKLSQKRRRSRAKHSFIFQDLLLPFNILNKNMNFLLFFHFEDLFRGKREYIGKDPAKLVIYTHIILNRFCPLRIPRSHRIMTLNTSTKTTLSPDQDSIRMFF